MTEDYINVFLIEVMEMADFKQSAYKHMRSARQWLVRAEEDFSKNDDIRGELNLFLAQAELQHLQEAKRKQSWRYRVPVLRHILAAAVAVFVIGTSFGGAYLFMQQRKAVIPIPLAKNQSIPVQHVPMVPVGKEVSKPAVSPSNAPALNTTGNKASNAVVQPKSAKLRETAVYVSNSQEGMHNSSPVDKDVTLSPNEMQKLIRAAGRSLRGE